MQIYVVIHGPRSSLICTGGMWVSWAKQPRNFAFGNFIFVFYVTVCYICLVSWNRVSGGNTVSQRCIMTYQGDRVVISVCYPAAVLTSHITKNFNNDKKKKNNNNNLSEHQLSV